MKSKSIMSESIWLLFFSHNSIEVYAKMWIDLWRIIYNLSATALEIKSSMKYTDQAIFIWKVWQAVNYCIKILKKTRNMQ